MPESRPPARPGMSAAEFRRWYWLKTELRTFAAQLGVSTAGSKDQIADRIAAALDGHPPEVPTTTPAPARRSAQQLTAPLSLDDVVPPGQRCSALVRQFMVGQVGPSFRFDAHMRQFFAQPEGRTLADAVALWHDTRDAPRAAIGRQFEYNTFVRSYRQSQPGASHEQVVAAWRHYRDTPVDQRPPVGES